MDLPQQSSTADSTHSPNLIHRYSIVEMFSQTPGNPYTHGIGVIVEAAYLAPDGTRLSSHITTHGPFPSRETALKLLGFGAPPKPIRGTATTVAPKALAAKPISGPYDIHASL